MGASVRKILLGAVAALLLCPAAGLARQAPTPSPVPLVAPAAGFTRSLFGPTGRMLQPGEGYVAAVAILVPIVQVGVTPWLELGGGVVPGGLFYVTPKFRVHQGRRTSTAAGLAQFFAPGADGGGGGLAYVVATRESDRGAWTYGGGVAYAWEREGDAGVLPVIQIGGERRLGRYVWFLSDNYVFGPAVMASAGIRLQGKHLSADFAVPVFIGEDGVVPGLLITVAWIFGR
jgi:hypothetical protein